MCVVVAETRSRSATPPALMLRMVVRAITWFKVDDGFWAHPKTLLISDSAIALWLKAGTWASQMLTDGCVPTTSLGVFGATREHAGELVEVGLWDADPRGYRFHDWEHYQPSAAVEKQKRADRAAAGRKGAEARWGSKPDGKTDGKSHGKPHGKSYGKTDAPSRPVPSSISNEIEHIITSFDDVWQWWPKKVEKERSEKEYLQHARTHPGLADDIRRFGVAYATTTDKQFIPSLAAWLHRKRWTDELPESRGGGRPKQSKASQNAEEYRRLFGGDEGSVPALDPGIG